MVGGNPLDFLDRNTFELDEFEATQRRLAELVAALARLLVESIEQAISGQFKELASDSYWTLLRRNWREFWGVDEVSVGATDIHGEAIAESKELAQLVLSRWLDALVRFGNSPEKNMLNQQMLPGSASAEEVLEGLPFEAYGLAKSQVVTALQQFVCNLAEAAGSNPIELGTRLQIASDSRHHRFIKVAHS